VCVCARARARTCIGACVCACVCVCVDAIIYICILYRCSGMVRDQRHRHSHGRSHVLFF
jgi:hypothetical protein